MSSSNELDMKNTGKVHCENIESDDIAQLMPFLQQQPWHPLQQQPQGSPSCHLSTGYVGEVHGYGAPRVIVHVQLEVIDKIDRCNRRSSEDTHHASE